MSRNRDSPTATANGRINPCDLPGSAAGPGSAASVKAACSVARQVEPLEPPSAGQALLCGSHSRGDIALEC
jgi:hypothetical protein